MRRALIETGRTYRASARHPADPDRTVTFLGEGCVGYRIATDDPRALRPAVSLAWFARWAGSEATNPDRRP